MTWIRNLQLLGLLVLALDIGSAAGQDEGAANYARMDLDGDGAVDADELTALRTRVFNWMDLDRDGELSEDEFVSLWIDKIADPGDPRRNALRELRVGRFLELDSDGDGFVPKQDYVDSGITRFLAADTNGDGKLSRSEFEGGGD